MKNYEKFFRRPTTAERSLSFIFHALTQRLSVCNFLCSSNHHLAQCTTFSQLETTSRRMQASSGEL